MNDPEFVPTRWQTTLLIIASVLVVTLFNIFAAKHLPLAEAIFVGAHILAFFPVVIYLSLRQSNRPAPFLLNSPTMEQIGIL